MKIHFKYQSAAEAFKYKLLKARQRQGKLLSRECFHFIKTIDQRTNNRYRLQRQRTHNTPLNMAFGGFNTTPR